MTKQRSLQSGEQMYPLLPQGRQIPSNAVKRLSSGQAAEGAGDLFQDVQGGFAQRPFVVGGL